jgi:hypothetical protein
MTLEIICDTSLIAPSFAVFYNVWSVSHVSVQYKGITANIQFQSARFHHMGSLTLRCLSYME